MKDFTNIYFVGCGGIGMAALVRYFLSQGKNVAGYDRTPTALTAHLIEEGAKVSYEDDMSAIPESMRNPQDTLVVYTPAVPEDNVPLSYFRQNGFKVIKRAALLGIITRNSKGICISGTHGKTTTSSMAAHILHNCKVGCNAFLGGILRNYNSNLLLSKTSPYSVIEADEYDRSFHQLTPYIAVITATDPDHLDIYGTPEAYRESFAVFTELIQDGGKLIVHKDIEVKPRVKDSVKIYSYGREEGDFHAENIRHQNGTIYFDFVGPDIRINDIELGVPVEINIDNAIAALASCYLTGDMEPDKAKEAVGTFLGAERRFQFHLKTPEHVVIDDYAHHPDEIKASIASVKALFPDRRLTVAFQPHLYSRTRDFAKEFSAALSTADEVILLDIYPAREQPIPGVTSKIIYDGLREGMPKSMVTLKEFPDKIKEEGVDVLLTVGAGDIYLKLDEIVKNLTDKDKSEAK